MICGDILQELRKDKGLTQGDVAKALHVVTSTISNYENGTTQPESDMIEKLADFYGVNIDYLYKRTRISLPIKELESSLNTPEGLLNPDDLVKLDSESKRIIKLLIDKLRINKIKNSK